MSDKRRSTLADQFMTSKPPTKGAFFRDIHQDFQRKLAKARKFIFDEEASGQVAAVIRDIPELLFEQAEFARPPFDLMWIEYNQATVWDSLNPAHLRSSETSRDFVIGYLIDHSAVSVAVSNGAGIVSMIPVRYHLNTVWPYESQLEMAHMLKVSRIQLDMILWGSSYNTIPEDKRRFLRDRNAIEVLGAKVLGSSYEERVFRAVVGNSAGDMRNIIAFLLMLNRPAVTSFQEVPSGHGWIRNRFGPYTAYNNVTISLNPVATLKMLGTPGESGVTKRRHEVRGHFCQNKESRYRGCIHDWQVDPHEDDDPKFPTHWRCLRCQGKRWWKHAHERGDASKGFVVKQYNVTS